MFDSYNNTDFSLSERKNIIDLSDEECLNIHNYSCNYSNFDIKTLRSICLCKIGTEANNNNTSKIKNDDTKKDNEDLVNLVKQNLNISKSSNIKVVKCISIIFTKDLFIKNYGFYIMFVLLLLNIITLVYSPISKIEKIINEYYMDILSKMKEVYTNKNNNDETKIEIIEENGNNNDLINDNNNYPENKNINENNQNIYSIEPKKN